MSFIRRPRNEVKNTYEGRWKNEDHRWKKE